MFSSQRVGGFDLDAHDFHEKMELCDVCGSFLVIGDVQLRVDAHLLGKQHLGFARIRATIAELKVRGVVMSHALCRLWQVMFMVLADFLHLTLSCPTH